MFLRAIVFLTFSFFSLTAIADLFQNPANPILSSYQVSPQSDLVMQEIAKKFEVTKKISEGTYEIILPATKVNELLLLDPDAVQIEADISDVFRRAELENPGIMNKIYDETGVEEEVQKIASTYPKIAKYEVYGKSKQGRNLFVLKISDNVTTDENEPELMITGATHGNEVEGAEVVMKTINALVSGYGKDPRLTKMVNDHELFFIPVVNVDGYASYQRYDNGVDPNREYAYPEQPDYVPNAASITGIVKFFHSHRIVGSIDYHASGGLVMYPWAYTHASIPAADAKIFKELGKKMAEPLGYEVGPISDIIYVAPGSSADYYYWKNHTLGYGIELNESFIRNQEAFAEEVSGTVEMTYRFIEHF